MSRHRDPSVTTTGDATTQQVAPAPARNGLGIVALVVGIVSVLLCWTVFVAIVLGIVALTLGIFAWRRVRRGEATNGATVLTGVATGLLGLVFGVALLAIGLTVQNSDAGKNYQSCVKAAGKDQAKVQDCQQKFQNDLSR